MSMLWSVLRFRNARKSDWGVAHFDSFKALMKAELDCTGRPQISAAMPIEWITRNGLRPTRTRSPGPLAGLRETRMKYLRPFFPQSHHTLPGDDPPAPGSRSSGQRIRPPVSRDRSARREHGQRFGPYPAFSSAAFLTIKVDGFKGEVHRLATSRTSPLQGLFCRQGPH